MAAPIPIPTSLHFSLKITPSNSCNGSCNNCQMCTNIVCCIGCCKGCCTSGDSEKKSVSFQSSDKEKIIINAQQKLVISKDKEDQAHQVLTEPKKKSNCCSFWCCCTGKSKKKKKYQITVESYYNDLVETHSKEIVAIIAAFKGVDFVSLYANQDPLRIIHVHEMNEGLLGIEKEKEKLRSLIRKIKKAAVKARREKLKDKKWVILDKTEDKKNSINRSYRVNEVKILADKLNFAPEKLENDAAKILERKKKQRAIIKEGKRLKKDYILNKDDAAKLIETAFNWAGKDFNPLSIISKQDYDSEQEMSA